METLTFLDGARVHRSTTVDFTFPRFPRLEGEPTGSPEYVPLALLRKEVLRGFDLRAEDGRALPLLTRDQNAAITGAHLEQQAAIALAEVGFETLDPWVVRALREIAGESVTRPDEPPSREALRQAVLESFGLLELRWVAQLRGVADCESYHIEVVVPSEMFVVEAVVVVDDVVWAHESAVARLHLHPEGDFRDALGGTLACNTTPRRRSSSRCPPSSRRSSRPEGTGSCDDCSAGFARSPCSPRNRDVASQRAARAIARLRLG